jgi:hypothetical protein
MSGDGRLSGDGAEPAGGSGREPRGVHNPRVVDLIELDRGTGEVVLVLLERRPWGSDPAQLRQLEAKLNSYLSYVLDGFLARDYPQYAGRRARFELHCAEPPRGEERAFLTAARNFAAGEGIGFAVQATRSG